MAATPGGQAGPSECIVIEGLESGQEIVIEPGLRPQSHRERYYGDAVNASYRPMSPCEPLSGIWTAASRGTVRIPWLGGKELAVGPVSVAVRTPSAGTAPGLEATSVFIAHEAGEVWILAGSPNVLNSKAVKGATKIGAAVLAPVEASLPEEELPFLAAEFAIRRAGKIKGKVAVIPLGKAFLPTCQPYTESGESWLGYLVPCAQQESLDPWQPVRSQMKGGFQGNEKNPAVSAPVTGVIWWSGEFDARNATLEEWGKEQGMPRAARLDAYKENYEAFFRAVVERFAISPCFKLVVIAPSRNAAAPDRRGIAYKNFRMGDPLRLIREAEREAVTALEKSHRAVVFLTPPDAGWAWNAEEQGDAFKALAQSLAEVVDTLDSSKLPETSAAPPTQTASAQ